MGTTVRARVRNGSLELIDKVELTEGAEVAVVINDISPAKDFDRFLRSAGSWRGLLDADKLIRKIYRDRLTPSKKRPRL